jgi:hypothetical protein
VGFLLVVPATLFHIIQFSSGSIPRTVFGHPSVSPVTGTIGSDTFMTERKRISRTKNVRLIPITQAHGKDREVASSSWRVSMSLVTSMSHIRPLEVALTRMSFSFCRFSVWTAAWCYIFYSEICGVPSILGNIM